MDHEGKRARCADGQGQRPASGLGTSMEKVRTVWLTLCERLQTGPAELAAAYRDTTVWINAHNFGDPALPFGGHKQSGWGREMGYEAIEISPEAKAVAAAL